MVLAIVAKRVEYAFDPAERRLRFQHKPAAAGLTCVIPRSAGAAHNRCATLAGRLDLCLPVHVNPPRHDSADNALSALSGLLPRHGGLPRQSLRQAADASGLTLAHLRCGRGLGTGLARHVARVCHRAAP